MTTTDTRRRRAVLVATAAAALVAAGAATATAVATSPSRDQVVAERGAEVMPFDLSATTHSFEPATDGGLQVVVADDPADAEQVQLIQSHLREEADAFARGDFDDPAQIHGDDMPGLAVLRDSAGQIGLEYRPRQDGAEIAFTSEDEQVVAALHDWFAAQATDHTGHAG